MTARPRYEYIDSLLGSDRIALKKLTRGMHRRVRAIEGASSGECDHILAVRAQLESDQVGVSIPISGASVNSLNNAQGL